MSGISFPSFFRETWMLSRRVLASSALSTGVVPFLTTCFGPRTEAAGFNGMTPPVVSQSKSILIAARCCFTVGPRMRPAKLLDVGRDRHGLDSGELYPSLVAPFEEPRDRSSVCLSRVRVPNVRREKLDEAAAGSLAGLGDDRGKDDASPLPCLDAGFSPRDLGRHSCNPETYVFPYYKRFRIVRDAGFLTLFTILLKTPALLPLSGFNEVG